MGHAILISSNEVINNLYEINLRAYVGASVTIKRSLAGALALLEQSPSADAIIYASDIEKNEPGGAARLGEFLKERGLDTPMVLLGEPSQKLEASFVIKNRYDIKSLLQTMAKILKVTAKDMAAREVPQFYPIPIKLFNSLEQSVCDIYYRVSSGESEHQHYKIIEAGAPIGDSLNKYLEEGARELYIDSAMRLKFINRASAVVVEELLRDDLSPEDRLELTSQGMGIVAEEIFETHSVSAEIAKISMACVDSMQSVIKEVPKLKNLLRMLIENKADYAYKHSILACYIAEGIIKNISWGSNEQISKVAFALFFHDIYLVPVLRRYPDITNEEDLLFRADVTEEDKEIALEHARMAGLLIKTFPRCPMGADMIITQHHGVTSGKGFAVNFKDDISPLSKIIIIAEEVASAILTRLQKGDGKGIAEKAPYVEMLEAKFKNHTYKKIIEAFSAVSF